MKSSRAALVLVAVLAACGVSWASERDKISQVLALRLGMHVADLGAGDGDWSVALARVVGESGTVYATEVKEDLIEEIRANTERAGLTNVEPVLGDQLATGLAAGCCDAILLRLVYHHFTRPAAMRRDLRSALKPGGRLAIIDIVPQENWAELPGVPDRGGHGIGPDDLFVEMVGDGFELLEVIYDWNGDEERFCAVFGLADSAVEGR